eukprot:6492648-Amphidinium_carterae.2
MTPMNSIYLYHPHSSLGLLQALHAIRIGHSLCDYGLDGVWDGNVAHAHTLDLHIDHFIPVLPQSTTHPTFGRLPCERQLLLRW